MWQRNIIGHLALKSYCHKNILRKEARQARNLSLAAVLLYNHPLKKNIIDSPDSLIRNERKREK
jgi:hypothetical protein